jgi:hypothetical protein
MSVTISGDTGISPVTATGTSALIDGMTVGRGAGEVSTNTAVGASALASNSTGASNTVMGIQAAYSMTGNWACAFGRKAMYSNTSGEFNIAVGGESLTTNTTGSNNVAIGHTALAFSTTASNNTAVGYQAGYSNTTGAFSVFLGRKSGYSSTTANYNIAIGAPALYSNTTGSQIVAIGDSALYYNTTGNYNVAIGASALQANTTASSNTAVGYQAGYSNQTGTALTAFGANALRSSVSVNNNVALGDSAGYAATGAKGTFIGSGSGSEITSGAANTILGRYNGNQNSLDIRTANNYIVLSDGDGNPVGYWTGSSGNWKFGAGGTTTGGLYVNGGSGTDLGPILIGQGDGTTRWYVSSYCRLNGGTNTGANIANQAGYGVYLNGATATSWTAVSDERRKDIIEPITNAAAKVSTLRAVIGKYKTEAEGARHPFLMAQDVLAVLPEAVSENEDRDGLVLGLSYTEVIPLLVAAIQELKAEIDTLKGQA